MTMRTFILSTLIVLSAGAAQAQRMVITVGGPNFRPFPVAAPALITGPSASGAEGKAAEELTGVLQSCVDLARSLELVPPKTYLAPEKEAWTKPTFSNWVNVGASGLVRGMVEESGGRTKITLRFFDVVAQRELLTRTYDEPADKSARAIHRFLDELVEMLTGEKGIFSTQIAFVKKTKGGKAIYTMSVDGRSVRQVTDGGVLSLLPAWVPNGQALLFTSYLSGNPDLYRIGLGSEKIEGLSSKRGLNTGAAVSPDGKRIALTLSTDGNTEIYVMDVGGENLRRLTDSWGQDVSPSWSPDGKRIAFVSSRAGNPHLYVMNADGSSPKRLTFQGNYNQEPDWSPRPGGQIAFTARDELLKYDIFLVDPETGNITRLTQDEGNNESPSHSPDGHHIVFTSTRPPHGGRKLYVMDVDGNNQRRVPLPAGDYETPAWGPRLGYE